VQRWRTQLETLWHSSAASVRRFLYRCVGNAERADDLLAQTFVEAAGSWHSYDGRGSRQNWLFGIARNVVRQERRRHRMHRASPLAHEPIAAGADCRDTDDDLVRMRHAIAELPEHLRLVLNLRLADEMSYEQIAGALNIPIGTVRSRLHEAVRKLRDRLSRLDQE
jgi:RNA polymerase sigma-70 factor (ECF subfamily)